MSEVKVKYMEYIQPSDLYVKAVIKPMEECCKTRKDLMFQLHRWVHNNIAYIDKAIGGFTAYDVLKARRSTCFGMSILLCSMLRAAGFNEEEVFVRVTYKRGIGLLNLHASVTVANGKTGGGYILDPLSGIPLYVRSFERYYECYGVMSLLAFNDRKAVLLKDVSSFVA